MTPQGDHIQQAPQQSQHQSISNPINLTTLIHNPVYVEYFFNIITFIVGDFNLLTDKSKHKNKRSDILVPNSQLANSVVIG